MIINLLAIQQNRLDRVLFLYILIREVRTSGVRELSILKLGTGGGEEFLEGYQTFWPRFIGLSNILEKIVKHMMGCEI